MPPPMARGTSWEIVDGLVPQGFWKACIHCARTKMNVTVQEQLTADSVDTVTCTVCKEPLAPRCFPDKQLRQWMAMGHFANAVCLRCDQSQGRSADDLTCGHCGVRGNAEAFDTSVLNITRDPRRVFCKTCARFSTSKSYLVKIDPCERCGALRDNYGNGRKPFLCEACRYPPCLGYGKQRPRKGTYMVTQMKEFWCKACALHRPCEQCGQPLGQSRYTKAPFLCTSCRFPPCLCGAARPRLATLQSHLHPQWQCASCTK